MGKKGTKKKTKWRTLPLGEEAGGSGNEEEMLDEDRSTSSSFVGQPAGNFKKQTMHHRAIDKGFRPIKRFPFDRLRTKEPLVKLESKTFDEEEYTKITTPRQDVLFKKGCFGRKRESSVEEVARQTGDMDGEEPMMDQIIITNGFVDERGHYLVNGNSYEIYDPYSNTVTVVVGPPPYANGVAQPVLAAVSCQPVPLQPVDWYPPGSDWPSQGSAWTPSFRRGLRPDPATGPLRNDDSAPEPPVPNSCDRPPYVVQELAYGEPRLFQGSLAETSDSPPIEEASVAQSYDEEGNLRKLKDLEEDRESQIRNKEEKGKDEEQSCETCLSTLESEGQCNGPTSSFSSSEEKFVEKQSHSTQTISPERERVESEVPGKESHSTQTPPEEIFSSNKTALKDKRSDNKESNIRPDVLTGKGVEEWQPIRKFQQNRYKEQNSSPKNFHELHSKKIYQQRKNFAEDKKAGVEYYEPSKVEKDHICPPKISYAKKAKVGLETGNERNSKANNGPTCPQFNSINFNGIKPNLPASTKDSTMAFCNKQNRYKSNGHSFDEKKNGYSKHKSDQGSSGGKPNNENSSFREFRLKESKVHQRPVAEEKRPEDTFLGSRSPSEKSSPVSGLSSPAELSSGQNTPPEKLIIRKMEEKIATEINDGIKQKLKQDLENRGEKEKEMEKNKRESETRSEINKSEEKKKKNQGKFEEKKTKEKCRAAKPKKKKKKKGKEEKAESDTASSEEMPFLSGFIQESSGAPLFGAWDDRKDFISDPPTFEKNDEEILKSLGIKEDKTRFSKLPLHSDLLTMLPAFGWGRPKLKIEDFFAPAHFHHDLYTKRNITNMKSTRPEEFFASVVDSSWEEKVKDSLKTENEETENPKEKSTEESSEGAKKNGNPEQEEIKVCSPEPESKVISVIDAKTEAEAKEPKLKIVEAVKTWLQEQGDAEKVLSSEKVPAETSKVAEPANDSFGPDMDFPPKNEGGNPIRASCGNAGQEGTDSRTRRPDGCMRVANVINDGFKHLDKEFVWKQRSAKKSRMYRSSSWDAKLSDPKIKNRLKFLTDSASFCQDLISDVRNGLPAKNEYATEELCDPKQSVSKYYTLAPGSLPIKSKSAHESDSDNEVFDALEYKFLTKENLEKRGSDGKGAKDSGNASITDSGVHSDVESFEDACNDHPKEPACKLQ